MVEHSLAIDRFRTSVALVGRREDAEPVRLEVGRAVRDLLPAAIGRATEAVLGGSVGVLRIDRIGLTLRLGRGDLSAQLLADRLARDLAGRVAAHARIAGGAPRTSGGVAFWPDHASFAAAYIAHRLHCAPSPDWAFADFRPLAHVSAPEAALELIAARPAILAALARSLGAPGAAALAAGLPEPVAATLVARLLAGPADLLPGGLAGAESGLAAMIEALPADIGRRPARAAIEAAMLALSGRDAPDADEVRQTVGLARLAAALATIRSTVAASWGRAPTPADLAPAALAQLPPAVRGLAEAALLPAAAEAVRAALLRVLARTGRTTLPPPADAGTGPAADARGAITSRLAGIGLLMPSVLAYGLTDTLSPAALHRVLVACAGPRDEAAARLDPLLAALSPHDPRDRAPSFPAVPAALRATVPTAADEGLEPTEGAAGWATCLMHGFAAGLSGFEASSPEYLRRQFLDRPGRLEIAERRMTLVLDPLPLGVVLRLSGLHGWTGHLPQARGALLRIEIREG